MNSRVVGILGRARVLMSGLRFRLLNQLDTQMSKIESAEEVKTNQQNAQTIKDPDPVAPNNSKTMSKTSKLTTFEVGILVVVFVAWLFLFVGGLLIPTQPYREAIAALDFSWLFWGSIFVVLGFYTITNVLILCVLTAMMGVAGSKARIELDESIYERTDTTNPYASAMLRGFVVYLVVLSGTMISVQDPIENFLMATQDQYVRLAALLSILGFLVGYSPDVFSKLISGSRKKITSKSAGKPGTN